MRGIMLTAFVSARGYLSLVAAFLMWVILPVLGGNQATVVMSGSMEPLVKTGDIVIAKLLDPAVSQASQLEPGNVILAKDPAKKDGLFTHRIVSIDDNGMITTKGDANASNDSMHVPSNDVIGIERLKVPMLGIPLQSAKTGNPFPAILFVASILGSYLLIVEDNKRHRRLKLERSENAQMSRKELRKIETGKVSIPLKLGAVGAVSLIALVSGVAIVAGSGAVFSGVSVPATSTLTASSSFPSKNTATCDSAVYKSTGTGTSVTCVLASISGTTRNYTLTVKTTSPTPIQWGVNADWNGVVNFKSAKGYSTSVPDTGAIVTKTYTFGGTANGSTNPADNWNYKYISSSKADIVFTVQVVTQ